MISIGKIMEVKASWKSFSTDEYSGGIEVLLKSLILLVINDMENIESCNNYVMPKNVSEHSDRIQYWYGDKESKARAWDIKYENLFSKYWVY